MLSAVSRYKIFTPSTLSAEYFTMTDSMDTFGSRECQLECVATASLTRGFATGLSAANVGWAASAVAAGADVVRKFPRFMVLGQSCQKVTLGQDAPYFGGGKTVIPSLFSRETCSKAAGRFEIRAEVSYKFKPGRSRKAWRRRNCGDI